MRGEHDFRVDLDRATAVVLLSLTLLLALFLALPTAGAQSGPDAAPAGHKNPGAFCKAERATILGTKGKDKLRGTRGDDVIVGRGGNDRIKGRGGDDLICGGGGKDKIKGQAGDDEIRGGGANDRIGGGSGDDDLRGNGGNDKLNGGKATDRCNGGRGNDRAKKCERGPDGTDGTPVVDPPEPPDPPEPGNEFPGATQDLATVDEDSGPTTIDVLANDTDPEGDPFTVGSVTQPNDGTVVITNAGADLTYEPDPDFCNDGSPTDDFTYALDPGGSAVTVAVTVTCIDDDPVAVDDSATLTEDDPAATIDVLANDTDVDGGPVTIDSVTQPADGTVVSTNAGADLTYEPDPDFCNDGSPTDDFTYQLDPGGSEATVTVTVDCSNDPPDAVNDGFDDANGDRNAIGNTTFKVGAPAGAGPEKRIAGASLVDNDTDPEGDDLSVVAVQGGSLSEATDQGGTVTVAADGTFTYDPAPGFTGDDTFTYTIEDEGGSDSSATATIEVIDTVWYVDSSAAGSADDGTSDDPFTDLADVNGDDANVDDPGETIFLFQGASDGTDGNAYEGGIPLEDDQNLIGEPAGLQADGVQLVAAAPGLPDITNDDGTPFNGQDGVALADGSAVRSVATVGTNGAGISADGVGGFTLDSVTVRSTLASSGEDAIELIGVDSAATFTGTTTVDGADAQGIDVSGATAPIDLGDVDVNGVLGAGIRLGRPAANAAAIEFGAGSDVSGAAGFGLLVRGGSADVTYGGTIGANGSNGGAVVIDERSGGAVTVDGAVVDSNSGIAIGTVGNNTGGSATFDGGTTLNTGFSNAITIGGSGGFSTTFNGALDIDTTTGTGISRTGSGTQTLQVTGGPGDQSINTQSGSAISSTAAINWGTSAFDSVSISLAAAGRAVQLTDDSGSLDLGGGTLDATADTFDVNGGTAAITYSGAVNNSSGNERVVEITGRTGGSVEFTGAVTDGGGGWVHLNNNAGSNITFSGGLQLGGFNDPAFTATNGGTVTVCSDTACSGGGTPVVNLIEVTGQTALNVANTVIGASGLNFRSIAADGGVTPISLDNTGSTGGLNVSGNGGTCNTAANCTGGSIANTGGDGISLSNTSDVSLSNVFIDNTGRHGITGTNVDGFNLADSWIEDAGNANQENAINFWEDGAGELSGTVLIEDTTFLRMAKNGISVENLTGSLDMTVRDSTFRNNINTFCGGSNCEGSGILMRADGEQPGSNSPSIDLSVEDTTFDNIDGDGIDIGADPGGTVDFNADGITGINNSQGDNLIDIAADGGPGGDFEFTISDFTSDANHRGTVIFAKEDGSSTMDGRIFSDDLTNNVISGSAIGRGIDLFIDGDIQVEDPVARVQIEDTAISNTSFEGLYAQLSDGDTAATSLDLTVDNVSATVPTSGVVEGMGFYTGILADDEGEMCLDITNSTSASPAFFSDIRLRHRYNTTFRLPGYVGGATDSAAIESFVSGQNGGISTVDVSISNGAPGITGGADCDLPVVD